ncbi:MAG TPA: hypothetical protein VEU32_13030 [Burkholderiales bacterium]|nr:hypothetical protein [Burkholderiales bacterium]
MKTITLFAAAMLASSAWAQQPAKEPARPTAAPAAAPAPAPQEAPKAEVAKAEPAKKHARKPNPHRQEDARHCLDKPTNTEIIKCAEAYL